MQLSMHSTRPCAWHWPFGLPDFGRSATHRISRKGWKDAVVQVSPAEESWKAERGEFAVTYGDEK